MTKGGKYYPAEYRPKNKPIYQIDPKTNKVIAQFDSSIDAANKLGLSYDGISRCVNHNKNRITAYGYKWLFVKEFEEREEQ